MGSMIQYFELRSRKIAYILDIPRKFSTGILFIPGVSGGATSNKFKWIADMCLANNMCCLRADLWDENTIGEESIDQLLEDEELLVDILQSVGCKRVFIVCKSFGSVLGLLLKADAYVALSPALSLGNSSHQMKLKEFASALDIGITPIIGKKPLLILQGSDDENVSVAHAVHVAENLPEASLLIIEGAGHSFKGYEDIVEQEIFSFLRSV